jgi:hypothetical protein
LYGKKPLGFKRLISGTRTFDDRRCEDAVWKVAVHTNLESGSKEEKTGGRRSVKPWPENGPKLNRRHVITVIIVRKLCEWKFKKGSSKIYRHRKKGFVYAESKRRMHGRLDERV